MRPCVRSVIDGLEPRFPMLPRKAAICSCILTAVKNAKIASANAATLGHLISMVHFSRITGLFLDFLAVSLPRETGSIQNGVSFRTETLNCSRDRVDILVPTHFFAVVHYQRGRAGELHDLVCPAAQPIRLGVALSGVLFRPRSESVSHEPSHTGRSRHIH